METQLLCFCFSHSVYFFFLSLKGMVTAAQTLSPQTRSQSPDKGQLSTKSTGSVKVVCLLILLLVAMDSLTAVHCSWIVIFFFVVKGSDSLIKSVKFSFMDVDLKGKSAYMITCVQVPVRHISWSSEGGGPTSPSSPTSPLPLSLLLSGYEPHLRCRICIRTAATCCNSLPARCASSTATYTG